MDIHGEIVLLPLENRTASESTGSRVANIPSLSWKKHVNQISCKRSKIFAQGSLVTYLIESS